jgi:cytochrome c556
MVGSNMDEVDSMLETGKIDMAEAREHSDNISMLLMVFPHLFPAASNEWKPNVERDPATDTFASPDLWTRFADFYRIATAASKTAYNASRSREAEEFKKYGAELRQACDGCHATFLKPQ